MSQIISRPIYIQPTYTLHCNHVPAQQGGWTGKTRLESITDLSISCGALGFIRRMIPNSNMHPLHVKEFATAGLYPLRHKRLPPPIFDLLQQFLQQGLRFRPHQSICPRLVIQFFTSPSQIGNANAPACSGQTSQGQPIISAFLVFFWATGVWSFRGVQSVWPSESQLILATPMLFEYQVNNPSFGYSPDLQSFPTSLCYM